MAKYLDKENEEKKRKREGKMEKKKENEARCVNVFDPGADFKYWVTCFFFLCWCLLLCFV